MVQSVTKKYNDHAVEYDTLSREAVPWVFFDKPYLETKCIASITPRSTVLEMGCGGGKVIDMLRTHGLNEKNVTGVDLSSELVVVAKKNNPDAHFIVGNMVDVELPQDYFDVVFSVRSLEYLNVKELKQCFQNVFDSMKKHGTFFIVTGHPLRVNDGDITTYLSRGARTVSLPWGLQVELYHKTMSDFLMAAISVGFRITYIDEPNMPKILKEKHIEKYEKYVSYGGATNLHIVLEKW
jgi:cyclopropane fatty-acyl-phospholipid synthase-like methyltransferase